MAKLVGGVTSSHIPAVGNAIANGLTQEPYWKRFFDGYGPAKAWLKKADPDLIIVVYNDHGLNFFQVKIHVDKTGAFTLQLMGQAAGSENHYFHIFGIGSNRLTQGTTQFQTAGGGRYRMLDGVHRQRDRLDRPLFQR